jgi:hypothetical protein
MQLRYPIALEANMDLWRNILGDDREVNEMRISNNTGVVIAFVAVVVLFLFFGFGAMSGSFMGGWTRGGGGMMGGGFGGNGWMWIPTLITLAAGVFLGWMLFGKKR